MTTDPEIKGSNPAVPGNHKKMASKRNTFFAKVCQWWQAEVAQLLVHLTIDPEIEGLTLAPAQHQGSVVQKNLWLLLLAFCDKLEFLPLQFTPTIV
jgi:hypothetical protein